MFIHETQMLLIYVLNLVTNLHVLNQLNLHQFYISIQDFQSRIPMFYLLRIIEIKIRNVLLNLLYLCTWIMLRLFKAQSINSESADH